MCTFLRKNDRDMHHENLRYFCNFTFYVGFKFFETAIFILHILNINSQIGHLDYVLNKFTNWPLGLRFERMPILEYRNDKNIARIQKIN
ncbi:unnamed protein product [Caenorhabditis angaria]|uniref:Uncharacterized protein n=1 Tax=Caenorhabditis angaria TaxID=860376 RepID=A0A9P1J510_9PELO|nr:unnamed protein product [Caenorhabditis angaria]